MPDPVQETLSARSYLSNDHGNHDRQVDVVRQRGRPRIAMPADGSASAIQVYGTRLLYAD